MTRLLAAVYGAKGRMLECHIFDNISLSLADLTAGHHHRFFLLDQGYRPILQPVTLVWSADP